jgi:hypothetical protein
MLLRGNRCDAVTNFEGPRGCGFVDDALRAPVSLPWTTLRVAHRANLRPQAPQPATSYEYFSFTFKTAPSQPEKSGSWQPLTSSAYRAVEAYCTQRLRRWLLKKHKLRRNGLLAYPYEYLFETLGLERLSRGRSNRPWATA